MRVVRGPRVHSLRLKYLAKAPFLRMMGMQGGNPPLVINVLNSNMVMPGTADSEANEPGHSCHHCDQSTVPLARPQEVSIRLRMLGTLLSHVEFRQ